MRKKVVSAPVTSHQSPVSFGALTTGALVRWCPGALIMFFLYFVFPLTCFAKEITILYTGETHAMLYHCNCPIEPDGGVARRASLIKQLRKENPNLLLLDSGGFFAGGLMDENTQNTPLDMQRTLVNLRAIGLMQYDALTAGDDEFNFGNDFFEQNIGLVNSKVLSCNLKSDKISPYLIKEVDGMKIGIIGATTPLAAQKSGKPIDPPKIAVAQAVAELKKNNVDVIILLSHLGEAEDLKLLKEVEGINIVIIGHNRGKEDSLTQVGSTVILRPVWQGRKLGKLSFSISDDKKIANYKIDEIRLSDQIKDDSQVGAILPRCFSDLNCKDGEVIGVCQNPGTLNASCAFAQASKVSLTVITPKPCRVCDPEKMEKFLKKQIPGLVATYLYYPEAKANKLINEFGVKFLPAYLIGKEIEKEKIFDSLKDNVEAKGNYYMLKPQYSGFSYLLNREKIKSKLDIFVSLYDKDAAELLDNVQDFNPQLHFLVNERDGNFDAAKGGIEVEDCLRAVCVQKYNPQAFYGYASCRAKNAGSSWWQDCAPGLDQNKIIICARGEEGKGLLKENIWLNKELQVMFGPTYLLDNQEVFSTKGVPPKAELKKLIEQK